MWNKIENFKRAPPFGYEHTNPDIKKHIKEGLQPEHLKELQNSDLIDLLKKLLEVFFLCNSKQI